MGKGLIFFLIIVIIIIGILGYKTLAKKEETTMPEETLKDKRVAMIVAFRDFRDDEYFVPREILEKAGAKITNVSNNSGTAIGADGGEVKIDLTLEDLIELRVAEYDAVVFIGGTGALNHLDNDYSYSIAKATISQDMVLGAICISPTILAKAGVLKGKRATVWSSVIDKSAVKVLEENGAIYENKSVVVDGKIITADGPAAAQEFGQKLVELLK